MNKKIVKKIKNKVIKDLENQIKNDIIKNLNSGDSKNYIKKLKKKIQKEVEEEMFGNFYNQDFTHTNDALEGVNSIDNSNQKKSDNDLKSSEQKNNYEYKGFDFDPKRMGFLVTENPKALFGAESISNYKNQIENPYEDGKLSDEQKSTIKDILKNKKENQLNNFFPKNTNPKISTVPIFSSQPYEKYLTPSKKEDLTFFIGKLKDGIDKLGKGERGVSYRKMFDNVYKFSFQKLKTSDTQFQLKFNFDLNIKTHEAKVYDFEFEIDGFKFDKSYLELIDIVKIFDLIGVNLIDSINDIKSINNTVDVGEQSLKRECKPRSVENISEFIPDKRIVKILQKNDINTISQLNKINELTSIKGVGSKTANKIINYLNKK